MEGKPVPGVRYRITPPSGETTEGTLNEFGQAGVYQIDPGKLQNYLLSVRTETSETWSIDLSSLFDFQSRRYKACTVL
jgi:hypothetical protein